MRAVLDADAVIAALHMKPHPEGGHYVETWRGGAQGGRATATAIYFLLKPGERSHWHRVDADEIWLHHAGGALTLSIADSTGVVEHHTVGADVADGQHPQVVVPAGCWQAAVPGDQPVLVSCVVAPGFEFDGFELAPSDWEPG